MYSIQPQNGRTWICWVSTAAQHLLETQKVLLAHRPRLPVILPAPQFSKLEGDDLQEEEGVGICPVLLVGSGRGNDAGLEPHNFLRGLRDEASI